MSRIVVGFDGSDHAHDAIALAAGLARLSDGELVIAAVYPFDAGYDAMTYGDFSKEARAAAQRHAASPVPGAPVAARVVVGAASAAHGLDRIAREHDADAIVVGSTTRGVVGRIAPGSTAERLLHGAPCSVAVAPVGYADTCPPVFPGRIGVAYDGSPEAASALRDATVLATRADATVRLISAVEPVAFASWGPAIEVAGDHELTRERLEQARRDAEEAAAELRDRIEVETEVLEGDPADVLVERSADVDLLVCGSRGYGLLRQVLLGGVSARLLRGAHCPVLVHPRSASVPDPEVHEAVGTG